MTNDQYSAALHLRYLAHRRRENRLNLIVGMSIVAFMFTMSLVPVMIIVKDLWV
jgi:hypothetical protein